MLRSDEAPRWPVLLALTVGVLAVHLAFLIDGWPTRLRFWKDAETVSTVVAAADEKAPGPTQDDNAAPPPLVLPVSSSTVRWIFPEPPKPVQPPAPKVRKKPPTPPPPKIEPLPEPEPYPADASELAAIDVPPPEEPAAPEPPPEVVAEQPAPVEAAPQEPAATPTAPVAATRSGAPSTLPSSAELEYDMKGRHKGLNYSASGLMSWRHDDQSYEIRMEVSAFLLGRRTNTSTGHLTAEGLAPDRFSDGSRSTRVAHFDYPNQRIRYSNNAPDAPLQPGTQDLASVSIQLASLFNAHPTRHVRGQVVSLPVTSASAADIWNFQVAETANLNLPAGLLSTRRLVRAPRREYDKTVEIWLAPTLQYLPARIRITEHNGDFIDQQLESLPPLAPPAAAPDPAPIAQ